MLPELRRGDGYAHQHPELRQSVTALQTLLGVTADGLFGEGTLRAVLRAQLDHELIVNGVVDAATWDCLLSGARVVQQQHSRAALAVSAATADLGQREKRGNSGFVSGEFERLMRAVGWFPRAAWCDFAVEKWWKQAFSDDAKMCAILSRMFTGGTLASWKNFSSSPLFRTGKTPNYGALVYWRHGLTTGHAGLVTVAMTGNTGFEFISGNTNSNGSREGYEVAKKTSTVNDRRLLGFVYIPE